jgi:hypothetical protein
MCCHDQWCIYINLMARWQATGRHCMARLEFSRRTIKMAPQRATSSNASEHKCCNCITTLTHYVTAVYSNILSRVCVTIDGVWIGECTYWPLTHSWLWTARTYNIIVDLHTLQIFGAHAKSSQSPFTSLSLVTDSSASVVTLLPAG